MSQKPEWTEIQTLAAYQDDSFFNYNSLIITFKADKTFGKLVSKPS